MDLPGSSRAAGAAPRRFALRPVDGYDLPPLNHSLRFSVAVTLNGRPVDGAIAADADAGFVLVVARDEGGGLKTSGGTPQFEVMRGAVTIGFSGADQPA